MLGQMVAVRNSVNQCLDIVDVSTWTGDPLNATFIYSQLHLLHETITEARQMLKGEDDIKGKWWETSADEDVSAQLINLGSSAITDLVDIDVRSPITALPLVPPLYCRFGSSSMPEDFGNYCNCTCANGLCF